MKNLLKCFRYKFSGGQTTYLQAKMQKFRPTSEQNIQNILNELYMMREYMPFHTPAFSLFVSNIESHYMRQKDFDRRSLKIYQMMEKMEMMTDNTKRIFHRNICKFLMNENTMENIRNQKLEHLLWWLYRQFPYQFGKFEQVSTNYTVRLYELFEYMNSIPTLPSWQPYIRVSYMLKTLGHSVDCRTDMFEIQTLQKIDRHYYLYLLKLFEPQKYSEFKEKMGIHIPLLQLLCDHYLMGDDIDYDKYLQRIEVIDNISAGEEVNRTLDSTSWTDLVEGWKLAEVAFNDGCLNEVHFHKFTQIFWRKLQTADIQVQSITGCLRVLLDNPGMFFENRQSIILRMLQSLYEKKDQEVELFPVTGYIELLKMVDFLPIDGQSVKKLWSFLMQKIQVLLLWQEGNTQTLSQLIAKKDFQGKERVIELLEKKKLT